MNPIRILLIEDNPGDVRLVREKLASEARSTFVVESAGRLSEGLKRLDGESFDVILLDLGLPDGNGLATFEQVQRACPAVPVVVLTGSDDQDVALQAIQEGAQDYLVKGSADGDRLWRAIRYGVERKKTEEAQRIAFERLGQIEELKASNQLKLQLISAATHELNTPLTPLMLQLHLLRVGNLGALSPRQLRAVDVLERNLDRLRILLNDLLDVARLQNGRLVVHRAPTDLKSVLTDAVETYEPAARQSGIRLELAAGGSMPVSADRNRLTQVVVNFLSNAMKFTPPGGRIQVILERHDGEAVVRVSDSGPGLTPDQIARLFAPFSQVHDPLRLQVGGTGLGLYISKGLVEQHEGRIWCESPGPGRGSTFCFALPVPQATIPKASTVPAPRAEIAVMAAA